MNCKIIIFDEPTSALTESETLALFQIMRELKKRGLGIIYISHRMAEVFGECDRISILRDGNYIGTYNVNETDSKTIVSKMVGREISDLYPPKKNRDIQKEEVIFEIKDFSDGERFKDISFHLKEGEILGLAGLVGAGRSEVVQAVCGLRSKINGEVFYKGQKLKINTTNDAIENGIVYLTEDRKSLGVFLELAIKQNISAMNIDGIARFGMIDNKKEDEQANSYIAKLDIKCRSNDQNASSLSGGNQQKVLISKLLTIKPKIMFMDEPTRGIDVGAKSEIHKLLRELANQGTGIVMISSELPEVIGMCDRVMVMHEGTISGEISNTADLNERKIIQLASGIND
jgi:ribose transport system ATP-binding protein